MNEDELRMIRSDEEKWDQKKDEEGFEKYEELRRQKMGSGLRADQVIDATIAQWDWDKQQGLSLV